MRAGVQVCKCVGVQAFKTASFGFQPPSVIGFVVALELLAISDLSPPPLVVAIPSDRLSQRTFELVNWLPTQFPQLLPVDGVSAVVSRSVSNEPDQAFGLAEKLQNQP
ncbi:MAG: hypothetical protein EORIYHIE_001618, partial [Candidatus Fervidibacter sp.]